MTCRDKSVLSQRVNQLGERKQVSLETSRLEPESFQRHSGKKGFAAGTLFLGCSFLSAAPEKRAVGIDPFEKSNFRRQTNTRHHPFKISNRGAENKSARGAVISERQFCSPKLMRRRGISNDSRRRTKKMNAQTFT
ncbi:hypothetical protein CDAR_294491 [Caerostris darwini]|uniref:Uncharacterized protein n=1 Tax=Caerostris darwini TaxID=1538125 RepID=A0AAV4UL04_9ARAC|nr:hypothetical protein CDAR_294491 [Caerostris darwini]